MKQPGVFGDGYCLRNREKAQVKTIEAENEAKDGNKKAEIGIRCVWC